MATSDQKELISVSKNQALGVGGAGVAVTTIVALTSTFLTAGDKQALQTQISQNKSAIEYMKTEIKEGFRDQKINLDTAVKDLEFVLRDGAKDRWKKSDQDRFENNLKSRLDRFDKRIEDLENK